MSNQLNQLANQGVIGLITLILFVSPASAALVFEDDFTGPAGSVEGRSTDGTTVGTNGTYFNANADIVYTDGVSNLTGVNPATQLGEFGTAAVDILAGGDLNTTNSIVTSTMIINDNRSAPGGDEFGTVFVQYDNLLFQGINNVSSGPAFAFQSHGAPFLLFKPGLGFGPLQPLLSSDNGNVTPTWLGDSNKIEFIYNTSTHAYQVKHNDVLVHSDFLDPDPNNPGEVLFWNYPTFDTLFFQFNNRNWVVDYISLDVTPIPEPGTAALFGLGLSLTVFGRRRLYAS